ncbi:MAG: hypothetical protein ACOX3T_03465 [Bdellovibrionota bacterium]
MGECNFKEGDKVQRLEGKQLCGTVKEVRAELRKPNQKESTEPEYMIKVLWDNGVESFFSPESLKKL